MPSARTRLLQLFKQLPIGSAPEFWPPFPDEAKRAYPALAERFVVLDAEVLPAFTEQDAIATASQLRYRRFRLALMVGAGLTTVAGALVAALGGETWPAWILAVLGLATTAIANQYQRDQPLARYITARGKAENLRSLYFRYLSGVIVSDQRALEERVAKIVHSRSSEVGDE